MRRGHSQGMEVTICVMLLMLSSFMNRSATPDAGMRVAHLLTAIQSTP